MSQRVGHSLIEVLTLKEEVVGNNHYRQQTFSPFLGSAGPSQCPHPVSPLDCYPHLSMRDLHFFAIWFFLPVHSLPDHK